MNLKSLILILLCLCLPMSAQAQQHVSLVDECPAGYKCIPEEVAQSWRSALEERMCQDAALDVIESGHTTPDLGLEVQPYTLIITKEGQIFSDHTIKANLVYCNLNLVLSAKPEVKVLIREDRPDDKKYGFRLRVRLGVQILPDVLWKDPSSTWIEPVLLLEPVFYKKFHLLTWGGLQSFGAGVGFDLTRNANIYGGVGGRWAKGGVGPSLGFSLSFN
jgi:hypothetical protein